MATSPNLEPATDPTNPEEWPEELQSLKLEAAPAPEQREAHPDDGQRLNWLFVDMNSYFASVEQDTRPELRGRPVAIVPMMADTTCCLAASYEAKAFGVKTGTIVADAKRLCPGLTLVEARHELYVQYHRRIVEAVESCLPVTAVLSVDEMTCRLMGRERPLLAAMELGRQVKRRILERVGPMMRSSVGLATNRYLAKVASDMEKPDGLVALPLDILPEALRQLTLRALPGIGSRMEKRLNEQGIQTMDQLLALDCDQAGDVWGSVLGSRLGHWLRGEDFDMDEAEHLKTMSHQHVLGPEMRTPEKAWAVAHKLLHKVAMRLRANGLWAGSIGLVIGFAVPRSEKKPMSRFGMPTRGWKGEIRLTECQDNLTLIAALSRLWASRPAGAAYDRPYFIGVHLNDLVPDRLHTLNLFDGSEEAENRARLVAAMDALNNKYGLSTLAPATMLTAFRAAPTRIAFHTIPELF
jgi:DNA polymerase-4